MSEKEYIVCCPGCKTFETLLFQGNMLVPTKKFTQHEDGKVYHDCGSSLPCSSFPEFIEEGVDRDKVKHRSHVSLDCWSESRLRTGKSLSV